VNRTSVSLYVSTALIALSICGFFCYQIVEKKVQDDLSTAARIVTLEILSISEQLSLFSELAPNFIANTGEYEQVSKLNRLIYGTRGVLSVKLDLVTRKTPLLNTFSVDGLFLNGVPQLFCESESKIRSVRGDTKFGEISLLFCGGDKIRITRNIENNDFKVGDVSVELSMGALLKRVSGVNVEPRILVNNFGKFKLGCDVGESDSWCSIHATRDNYIYAARRGFLVFVVLLLLSSLITWVVVQLLLVPLNDIREALLSVSDGSTAFPKTLNSKAFWFSAVNKSIMKLVETAKDNIELRERTAVQEGRTLMASQIAHDIRSPLAALEMALPMANGLSEENRQIFRNSINRIRDIANTLLSGGAKKHQDYDEGDIDSDSYRQDAGIFLISPVIESIVAEKRIQYRNLLNLTIRFDLNQHLYGLFGSIRIIDFKRALSNLIDNAVEATQTKNERLVSVALLDDEMLKIKISDNGVGIEANLIPELGKQGRTYGKVAGNGLGVFQAKRTIEEIGGSLTLTSVVGVGTEVALCLPKESSPHWFVSSIIVSQKQPIFILDDDRSIHDIWSQKFNLVRGTDFELSIFSSGSPREFRSLYGKHFFDAEDPMFLMDYELLGCEENGIDLMEEFDICERSILVTSHYENVDIQKRCERLGVKLIPKSLVGFVPVYRKQF
jgi:signal transduction histidine kinase